MGNIGNWLARAKSLVGTVALFCATLLLSSCFNPQTPSVSDPTRMLASFSHTGLATCAPCHEKDRPAPVNGLAHGNGNDCVMCHAPTNWATGVTSFNHSPLPSACAQCHATDMPTTVVNNFDHQTFGMGDCVNCHAANAGVTWLNANFVHTNSLTTCSDCHSSERPSGLANGFDHSVGGMGDCITCHTTNIGVNWLGATFSHNPTPTTCAGCHSSERPSGSVNGFDHSQGGMGDCAYCHAASAGVNWLGAAYAHNPVPTTCIACHAYERPTTVMNGFDHSIGGMGDCAACHKTNIGVNWLGATFSHNPVPAACASCHSSEQPTTIINEMSHQAGGIGDCAGCHSANVGVSWTGGTYSHNPAPASCSACHSPQRPTSIINGFNHSVGGMGDCATCHLQPGVTWSGASFSHNPKPATCAGCHASERPTTVVNNFNHALYGTGDCASCHNNAGVSWAGGIFPHSPAPTGCNACHTTDTVYTAISSTVKNQMNHSLLAIPDCVTCHTNAASTSGWTSWVVENVTNGTSTALGSKGSFHANMATVTTCQGCHSNERPSAIVSNFNHTLNGNGDCVTCHTNPGLSWAGGNVSHSPTPTACYSCHVADPLYTAIQNTVKNQMNHSSITITECVACHGSAAAASNWASWNVENVPNGTSTALSSKGTVHTNKAGLTTCQGCHSNERPVAAVNGFSHAANGTGDCVSCHTNQGLSWAGGQFSHSPTPTSCNSCHISDSVYTAISGTIKNQMVHTAVALPDCIGCHGPVAAASAWTSWVVEGISNGTSTAQSSKGVFHTNVAGLATCQACHANERPTTTINGFSHATSGTGDCVTCHTNPGLSWAGGLFSHSPTPATCTSCHTNDTVYTSIAGTVKNEMLHTAVTLPDCATCHSAKAAASSWANWSVESITNGTTTALGSKGAFHANVSSVTTCQGCHTNERPATVVGGFSHATNGTGDCVSCHANPGLSWAGGIFNHSPTPATCASCHTSDTVYTAISTTVKNQMNHSSVALPDCATCHSAKAAASSWANWSVESVANGTTTALGTQGSFHANVAAPATCQGCHTNERPTATVNGFSHATNGTGDCVSCHNNPGLSWAGGNFTHSPAPATCASCHTNDTVYTAISGTVKNEMLHTAVSLPDCATCHSTKAAASNWANWVVESINNGTTTALGTKGSFHANVAAPATCQGCHTNERPNFTINGFSHVTNGTGDCVSCHNNPGLSWAGGLFSHSPTPTTCYTCHISDSVYTSISSTVTNQMNHSAISISDCVACHGTAAAASNWASWNAETVANGTSTARTTKGIFHTNTAAPTSCTACHTNEVPAGTVPNTADGFNHLSTYGTECYTCHTVVAANTGLKWSGGFFNHNNNNAASFTNCSPCHDTKQHHAGSNCYTCHGSVMTWPTSTKAGAWGQP
jgi:Class III cytochrome C family